MRKATAVLAVGMVSVWVMGQRSASAEPASVSFRLATVTPTRGFESIRLGDQEIYVSSSAVLSGAEVVLASGVKTRDGSDVALSLTDEAAGRLRSAMAKSGADRLAFLSGSVLLGAGPLTLDATGGVTVSGLSSVQAERVVRLINGGSVVPLGGLLSVVPTQSMIAPGGAVTVDVFASGIPDLRTYQVTLEVRGGESGVMVLEDLRIDTGRPDYVFGTLEKIDAADFSGGRLGGVLFHGGVDATRASYLGTGTFRASTDASGTFQIGIRTADGASLAWSSANQPTVFATASAAISVGKAARPRPTNR